VSYVLAFDRGLRDSAVVWIMLDDGSGRCALALEVRREPRLVRYFFSPWAPYHGDELPPDDLLPWLHAHAAELAAEGFPLRRWWHLWPCRECGAAPLAPCRSLGRVSRPMHYAHKGRRPRPPWPWSCP